MKSYGIKSNRYSAPSPGKAPSAVADPFASNRGTKRGSTKKRRVKAKRGR